jgi:hypothetical protein
MNFTDEDLKRLKECLTYHNGHAKAECFDEKNEDITHEVFAALLARLEAAELLADARHSSSKIYLQRLEAWRKASGRKE